MKLPEYEKLRRIDLANHEQKPGTIIHEIHMIFPNGGYAIRFVEAPDTPEWEEDARKQAQTDALTELYHDQPERQNETGNLPRITTYRRHDSWEVLKKSRGIDKPRELGEIKATTKDKSDASILEARRQGIEYNKVQLVMRKEKVHKQVEDALDFIDTLPPI